jgi:dUTP pyrophosphatase
MEMLKYCKVKKVKSPNRAHPEDAGIDFYFPENITEDEFLQKCKVTKCYVKYTLDDVYIKTLTLEPGESILLPSGIHIRLMPNHALIFFNKSSVASKMHLDVGAQVCDEKYTGECHINLVNTGVTPITLTAGDKLIQGVVMPINYCQTEEYTTLESLYENFDSDRGAGGFGSTGSK